MVCEAEMAYLQVSSLPLMKDMKDMKDRIVTFV